MKLSTQSTLSDCVQAYPGLLVTCHGYIEQLPTCTSLRKKATIHLVTTMAVTSKNVLLPGGARAIIKVSGHQYQWLAGGYDLEIGHFQKWPAWWLPGG